MSALFCALIRHGDYHQLDETPSAWQPYPLTSEGETQAQLSIKPINDFCNHYQARINPVCHSSNMLRSWQTAQIISDNIAEINQILCFDDLAERGVGSAANLSIIEIEKIIANDPRYQKAPQNWKSDSHFRLPFQGAESLIQAGKRVAEHINKTMQELKSLNSENVLQLFVGHGAAFRHAAYHLKALEFEQIKQLSMYHAQPVFFKWNDNSLVHIDGEWKVRSINTSYTD